VRDTGAGIAPDLNIDEPFTTTKPSGSGLGLMIVRQIVARHQGSLSYKSEVGKGSAFLLRFSLSPF